MIALLIVAAIIGFNVFVSSRYTYFSIDPNDFPEIVDRSPLKMLKINSEHHYVLVKHIYAESGVQSCSYISENDLLFANKDIFILTNKKNCYFTTCDSWFEIYEDGVLIDSEIFDSDPKYTLKINYGSLENAFIPIDLDDIEKELLN